MVMLYMQKDGTMGPQNPVNLTNQNSLVAQANRGGPVQNQARRELMGAAKQTSESPEKKPRQGANRGAVGTAGSGGLNVGAGGGEAGLVGSVNTEVQNDDVLLPYQKP